MLNKWNTFNQAHYQHHYLDETYGNLSKVAVIDLLSVCIIALANFCCVVTHT